MILDYLNFLNERLTQKIYHFTYVSNLTNILKENAFFCTPVVGTDADLQLNKGKFYMFSMQTSRHGKVAYAASVGNSEKVCINLNGDKLNQRYKGGHMDYWKISKDPLKHKKTDFMQHLTRFDELEERIFTDKPKINNAKSYIDEIHVMINEKIESPVAKRYLELKKYINDVNIYFYDDAKYFDNQTKNKSIDINEIDFEKYIVEDDVHQSTRFILTRVIGLLINGDDENKNKIYYYLKNSEEIKQVIENRKKFYPDTTIKTLYDSIEKSIKDDMYNYLEHYYDWDWKMQDYYAVISAEIHNHKSDTSELARFIIHMLTKDMRKHKVTNIKDYIIYKANLVKKNNKVVESFDNFNMKDKIKEIEEKIGYPTGSWKGNCYGVSYSCIEKGIVQGKLRYGQYTGPMSKTGYYANNVGTQQHAWVELPNGDIWDATRWVFENKEPYIYIGPNNDEYDIGANKLKSLYRKPPPPFNPKEKTFDLSEYDDNLLNYIKELLVDTRKEKIFTINQLFWLSNENPKILGQYAKQLYNILDKLGFRAFIPIDNWDWVIDG